MAHNDPLVSQTHTLRPICGNCDELVLNFFETDEMDRRFFDSYRALSWPSAFSTQPPSMEMIFRSRVKMGAAEGMRGS